LTSGGLAAVTSSFFAALYSAFGKYDVVHIHAEGPAFFSWLPKMFGKRVVVTIHGIDWQREKWQSGLGSKFIHQGEKNAVKYADEVIVLSKGVQDYFKETYGRKTHFIPNGVNRPQTREASLITDKFGLKKDSYILFLGRLVPEKGMHMAQALRETGSYQSNLFAKRCCRPIYINNYGAFLQAWALREAIAELFPNDEVQIIDYVNLKHFIINAGGWFRFYKNRESFKDWMEKIKLPRTFAKARNQEMVLSKRCFNAKQINALDFDCIIVGSDEVWNYKDTKGNAALKFGEGLTCKNLIAYF
jgi:hypothetical protein